MDTIKVGVSSLAFPEKLAKGDPRWRDLTSSFQNEEMSVADLANAIWTGHAFTVWLKKPWRDTANYLLGHYLCLDFDREGPESSIEVLKTDPFINRYATLIYETYSSNASAGIFRSRVLFALDGEIHQAANYVRAASALLWLFSTGDPQCRDAARQWMGTYRKDIYLLDNRLPLNVVQDLIKRYEETGKRVRERYVPKPFTGSNDDETLQRLESMMASAASGNRNATLNEVGYILGLNIAQGRIDRAWGMSTIASAAQMVGLDDREIDYHLRRSVEHGMDAAMLNLNTKGMH